MNKVLVIGIDGMDIELLDRWRDLLPTFGTLRLTTPPGHFISVFPPDTTPAWSSIYLGLNPAEHGVINLVNIADRKGGYAPLRVHDGPYRGRTFWDKASKAGCRVVVLFPMNVYPGWQVNGILLAQKAGSRLMAHPVSILEKYHANERALTANRTFVAESQLARFYGEAKAKTLEEARIAEQMLKTEEWDLFFVYFSALDGVQHSFWSYCDPDHPNYPGPNDHQNAIRDFYRLMDDLTDRLISQVPETTTVMILSDHGHGARPSKVLNLNEVLRLEGLLSARNDGARPGISASAMSPLARRIIAGYVRRFGVGRLIAKLSKRFPVWKSVLTPSSVIDWSRTLAYVSDLSAVKNYSYGGIRFNRDVVRPSEDEALSRRVLDLLGTLTVPETGKRVVKWASRREDIYQGQFLNKYPEILVELDERYGIGWDVGRGEFGVGDAHQVQPGGHRRYTAVLLSRNMNMLNWLKERRTLTLMDIAPLVLESLGVHA